MTDAPLPYARPVWPRLWRLALLALSTLILCSCSAAHRGASPTIMPVAQGMPPGPCYPAQPLGIPITPPYALGQPTPAVPPADEPWAPPGLARPWPADEYLCDGGDATLPARVTHDWHIHGLELEDTVAHFDTLDGHTVVEPSNRVCLYAPRFGAVRSVTAVVASQHANGPRGVDQPVLPVGYEEVRIPAASQQHLQTIAEVGRKQAGAYLSRQGDGQLSKALLPLGYDDRISLGESLTFLRDGKYEQSQEPYLAAAVDAAIAWTGVQAVQVLLDDRQAREEVGVEKTHSTYVVDDPRGPGRLRVVKGASEKTALPGETVEFAIRFDNLGGQVIGNVTIIDNLSPRLEYLEGSARTSLPADFITEPNEAGSLVLRFEFTDPLPAGDGGLVTFQCRVR